VTSMPDVYPTGSPIFDQMAAVQGNPYDTPVFNSLVDPLGDSLTGYGSGYGYGYGSTSASSYGSGYASSSSYGSGYGYGSGSGGYASSSLPAPVPSYSPAPVQPQYPQYADPNAGQNSAALARLLTDTLGGGGANCVAVLIFGNESMAQQLQQFIPNTSGPTYAAAVSNTGTFSIADTGLQQQQLAAQHPGMQAAAMQSPTVSVPALPPSGGWISRDQDEYERRSFFGRFGAAMRELRGR